MAQEIRSMDGDVGIAIQNIRDATNWLLGVIKQGSIRRSTSEVRRESLAKALAALVDVAESVANA